ncbi:glutathione peroxidase [Pseudidiomarina sediminum]|uniref:glutathione peroxidase n=1 Tax=Pseudidiomarina sediminum TaxID=431675 RepID=UPI001C95E5C9|nr:glutathione peroxidase [Pseudidiomarina sediminum]MBY6064150.1 glutathione peroxidase [Pseudidiomarina sediminum]
MNTEQGFCLKSVLLTLAIVAVGSIAAVSGVRAAAPAETNTVTSAECLPQFQGEMRALHSKDSHNLCELTRGKVVMVVNTASQCGYTGQFADLEALYQDYKEKDFVILGFPSDSFKQEHADEEKTASVCFVNFGVTFPMMATTPVTGSDANPVFQAVTAASGTAPKWNFHKYIVAADGSEVQSFPSKVVPTDSAITDVIDSYLAAASE